MDGKNKDPEHVQEGLTGNDRNVQEGRKGSKGKEKKPFSAVMFVPWTSKGRLVSRLKEEEDRF